MRKKIETFLANLKKPKAAPVPFKTVEEVTEASRKADGFKRTSKAIETATMAFYVAGMATAAAVTAAGIAVSVPVAGAAIFVLFGAFGASYHQLKKAHQLNGRIRESVDQDGRRLQRTYNEQEIAKLEADLANKEKLEKSEKTFAKISYAAIGVMAATVVGGAVAMTVGVAIATINPVFIFGWVGYGVSRLASIKEYALSDRVHRAEMHGLEKEWRVLDARLAVEEAAEEAALANTPAAGKDFAASADKDAPKAEKPAQTPAVKPAPAPKGPTK